MFVCVKISSHVVCVHRHVHVCSCVACIVVHVFRCANVFTWQIYVKVPSQYCLCVCAPVCMYEHMCVYLYVMSAHGGALPVWTMCAHVCVCVCVYEGETLPSTHIHTLEKITTYSVHVCACLQVCVRV